MSKDQRPSNEAPLAAERPADGPPTCQPSHNEAFVATAHRDPSIPRKIPESAAEGARRDSTLPGLLQWSISGGSA